MIAIIDYGMGNIHSVQKALESMSAEVKVSNIPKDIIACDKIVLPGVGAFGDAIAEIEKQGLVGVIKQHIKKNKPFLGICLGMHLLFSSSDESIGTKGLGLLKGGVIRFPDRKGIKVPHMGWNQLEIKKNDCPLLRDLKQESFVYFCHSYFPVPKDREFVAATTQYGTEFSSFIWQDNVFAAQFHPEKSQTVGLKILENFVKL